MRFSAKIASLAACLLLLCAAVSAPAQAPQRDGQSFDQLLELAQARTHAQDWEAAASLWASVVEINPHVAGFSQALATARLNLGDHRQAIEAFEKALALGAGRPYNLVYQIARSHAALGDQQAALDSLERAIDLGFRSRENIAADEAFAAIRGEERFRQVVGIVDTSKMTREQGWSHDLNFLAAEVRRMHYQPFNHISPEAFDAEVERLRAQIPQLTELQFIVGVMHLMSLIGDGHTNCFPEHVPGWTHTLPLQFDQFTEGLYVISADPSQARLVGSRVMRIGEHTPEEVFKALTTIISRDNEQGFVRSFGWYLRYPQVLCGLGLQREADRVTLTLQVRDGGEEVVTVKAIEQERAFNRITSHPKWVNAYDAADGPVPRYLRNRRAFYWFEPLEDGKTLYFQFNVVTNDSLEPFETFVTRLFKHIDDNEIDRLVIDLRWNNGGNSLLLQPLIHGLIRSERINRPGRLYVLVGRYTFSAGMNAATYLDVDTEAIFVGEPTPSSPNYVGESNHIFLPYSRVPVSISDLFHQASSPVDSRTWIAPEIFVAPSFEAFSGKRDLALEAVLERRPEGA